MGHVGPLIFFVSLGIAEIHDFPSFQFILKLSYSNPFHNIWNYASTANIEEVTKFDNLGDKTFETDSISEFEFHAFSVVKENYAIWL